MSVTTGTTGVDATPATTLYNLLATAMTANGNWAEEADSPVAAATAGTTADVRVWKCTGGAASFYVFIEVDNTNNRLRFRMSEYWDATAHRLRQPAGGGTVASATDGTSVTPTANGTVTDTDTTIGSTNPNVSFVQVNVLGSAYNYLYEVRDNLITVATRVSATNYYCIAGCFTSLITALTDSFPLTLLGHPSNTGLSGTAGGGASSNNGRFTRLPGFGASAVVGGFSCFAVPLMCQMFNSSGSGTINFFSSIGGTTSNPWYTNHLVCPVIVHGAESNSYASRRGFRGHLPDFVAGYYTTEPAVVTDTVTVSGVTYYPLGRCYQGAQIAYIAIKA
jgi:hypothetical protein